MQENVLLEIPDKFIDLNNCLSFGNQGHNKISWTEILAAGLKHIEQIASAYLDLPGRIKNVTE